VPGVGEMLLQGLAQLESGMIGRDVDAHDLILGSPALGHVPA
jgi:hypothetical protein